MNKLNLNMLKVNSFIIEQSKDDQQNIKSGFLIGSEGPTHTSGPVTFAVSCVLPITFDCYTQNCDFISDIKTCNKS